MKSVGSAEDDNAVVEICTCTRKSSVHFCDWVFNTIYYNTQ